MERSALAGEIMQAFSNLAEAGGLQRHWSCLSMTILHRCPTER